MEVVPVACNEMGQIDMKDFKEKLERHSSEICGAMITYPSTYGVFENTAKEICDLVH